MLTIVLAAAWLIGVAGAAWAAPGGAWTTALLATVPAVAGYRRRPALMLCAAPVCAGMALLAAARWQAVTKPPPVTSVARLVGGGPVRLHGVLRGDPEERARSQRLRVEVREADTGAGWRTATDAVLVRVPLGRTFRAGDAVLLEGRLTAPPDLPHFDYRAYLARQGIRAEMDYPRLRVTGHVPLPASHRWLLAGRRAASAALDRVLPQPEAALARGIVVGDRSAIPDGVADDFNRSGTSHLIAISGFNITLAAGMVIAGLSWLIGRRPAALVALGVIAAYAVFVGLSPSVARALVMGALVIAAAIAGRPGAPLIMLVLAAVAMTVQDPRVLEDVGFQLSFTATAGLMLIARPLQDAGRRLAGLWSLPATPAALLGTLWDVLAVSLAAGIATLPVMLHAFGQVSPVAPVANLVLVPVFPLVMLTSGAAVLLGALPAPVHAVVGMVARPPLGFTIAVAHAAAGMSPASPGPIYLDGRQALALYTLGAVVLAAQRGIRPSRTVAAVPELHPGVGWLATAAATALLLGMAGTALHGREVPDGRLTVTFAEAGGVPVALITGPSGERVLIDAGPTGPALVRAADPLLPSGRLDLIVVTRVGPSVVGGLPAAVERYRPRAVAGPATREGADLPDVRVPIAVLEPGSRLLLSRGARVEFEAVSGEPDRLAAVAVFGSRRIAVTPGAVADAGAARLPGAAAGEPGVTAPAASLRYSVRTQGPIRVSTDGTEVRLRPTHGPLLPASGAAVRVRP